MSSNDPSPDNTPDPAPQAQKPPRSSPVNNPNPDTPRRIIKKNSGKELIMGLVIGAAVLGFIVYATLSFNAQIAGLKQEGTVIEKTFVPDPEVQITVGEDGVRKERIPGNYYLKVRMDDGSMQTRFVDRVTFARYEVGDPIEWVKNPPSEWELARREVEARQAEQQQEQETGEREAPQAPAAGTAPPEMPLPVDDAPTPAEPAENGSQ
jgi:hypothetical protein